ncbi:MAG TPA: hypothetical protein VGC47_07680 [Acidimicrobiia bacterium]
MPDVPTFSVDDGFAYSVPDSMSVSVGSIVRVPLGGRRVRGWVVDVRSSDKRAGLKSIISVSSALPIFGPRHLETLRWAALHHVAPVAALLPRAGPPNLPRAGGRPAGDGGAAAARAPLSHIADAGPWDGVIGELAAVHLPSGRNVVVLVPTVVDVAEHVKAAAQDLGDLVVGASSDLSAAEVTATWVTVNREGGRLLFGTREVALWSLGDVAAVAIVEPGRRVYKARQTPTVHARDVMRRRANVERFGLVTIGAVPPLEIIAAGATVRYPKTRVWPLVEVLDRSQEAPGAGIAMEATRRAIAAAIGRGERVFVFVPRRGYAPAFRCVRCRTLRRCPACGAGPDRGDACRRCGARLGACDECGGRRFEPLGAGVERVVEDLRRSFGDAVGGVESGKPVRVGTERDVPAPQSVDLAVALDVDALLLAPHYRAEEEALRILARVAAAVRRGRGHRAVVQTSQPHHRVVRAIRAGSPAEVISEILVEREAAGLPPIGQLMAVEVLGDDAPVDKDLREAVDGDGQVFGPAEVGDRARWLVQGAALYKAKVRMRPAVQRWRDQGIRVRVDADPIDL